MGEMQRVRLGESFHADAGETVEVVVERDDQNLPLMYVTLDQAGRWVIGGELPTHLTDAQAH